MLFVYRRSSKKYNSRSWKICHGTCPTILFLTMTATVYRSKRFSFSILLSCRRSLSTVCKHTVSNFVNNNYLKGKFSHFTTKFHYVDSKCKIYFTEFLAELWYCGSYFPVFMVEEQRKVWSQSIEHSILHDEKHVQQHVKLDTCEFALQFHSCNYFLCCSFILWIIDKKLQMMLEISRNYGA